MSSDRAGRTSAPPPDSPPPPPEPPHPDTATSARITATETKPILVRMGPPLSGRPLLVRVSTGGRLLGCSSGGSSTASYRVTHCAARHGTPQDRPRRSGRTAR